ncbi:MAG: phytanoyl-CoA dioxygenase family protein, partial [Solirubrobacteraceae bacterium]
DVPHQSWHLDYTAPGAARGIPGAQVFLCVDEIAPGAGGTVVAAGVQHLIDAIRRREGPGWSGRSLDVRKALQREAPWIRDLGTCRAGEDRLARFMASPTRVKDVELQVVELVGEPGDVYVMHPWLLHAPAPNCGSRPRMGLTERIHARRVRG